MTSNGFGGFPSQMKSDKEKGTKWRRQCMDWANNKTFATNEYIRHNLYKKQINYDLVNGKIHMSDMKLIINPSDIKASYIPKKIQHYPIINTKLQVLLGEELKRLFEYRVVITNPNAISEIEGVKKQEFFQKFQELLQDKDLSEEDYQSGMQKLSEYYTYDYQDIREIRANALINHYSKEQDFPQIFNHGFNDALIVGEEIYQVDIIGGEPVLQKLSPMKVRAFKYGYSNRIEDASMVILEDYYSPERILDMYYDDLTASDLKKIEEYLNNIDSGDTDEMDNENPLFGLHRVVFKGEGGIMLDENNDIDDIADTFEQRTSMPFDMNGNIRVIKLYWKSKRKIKRVKTYNQETGEEEYMLYPQDYKISKEMGEEEKDLWINEAWEGTLIGKDIYVNIRPRLIQYNTMSNPSKCHFGIIGQVYNTNDDKPFCLIDMMKTYNYQYDMVHNRLDNLMERNWGVLMKLDFAKIPKGWSPEKWLYFAKTTGIAVEDSFKAGNEGPAMGKLAGALNNNSNGVIQAELRDSIKNYTEQLMYIEDELARAVGINQQREGNIMASETVGGVERANLQSSYITERIFAIHDNVKKRVLEAFLETAKIALKGKNKKFQYILADHSLKLVEINGDEFAECDYGLVVDGSQSMNKLQQNLETLAQAALQNQMISFGSMMKMYGTSSLAEKQRIIETEEKRMQEQQAQAQQQQMQQLQMQEQTKLQIAQQEMELKDKLNERDNATKIRVAEIQAQGNRDYLKAQMEIHSQKGEHDSKVLDEKARESDRQYRETQRQFDKKYELDKEKQRMNNVSRNNKSK